MRQLLLRWRYGALRPRHDWWYRWAHDPLCDRLGSDVLAIGKLRLCRSCIVMYAGMASGAIVATTQPVVGAARFAPHVWAGTAAVVAGASIPQVYGPLPRPAKDAVRFGAGILVGIVPAFARARRWHAFVGLAATAAVAYRVLSLARVKNKATACEGCPELHAEGICSGFSQQAVSMRAYERAASDIAMKERARAI